MATLARYNQLPTFFNPFYSRPVINRYYNTTPNVPAVNVKETETAYILELAAPG
jgi:HSP20 family protein